MRLSARSRILLPAGVVVGALLSACGVDEVDPSEQREKKRNENEHERDENEPDANEPDEHQEGSQGEGPGSND